MNLPRAARLLFSFVLVYLFLVGIPTGLAQPAVVADCIQFVLAAPRAQSVCLAGDFNNWDPLNGKMARDEDGIWRITILLQPGYYQYRFVVDKQWMSDPKNPAMVLNNYGEPNSVFDYRPDGTIVYAAYNPLETTLTSDSYTKTGGTLYLAIVWHQHQPFYLDAEKDQLIAPWVRTHATKDYYDMTAMLQSYPDVHVCVNLTPVLLLQIEEYYLERLLPFYDPATNRIRAEEFLAKWRGRTDPWVDLMLTPTQDFGPDEDYYLYGSDWNCFGISSVQIGRFPEYLALQQKPPTDYTLQDRTALKCWFYLAHFDPDFLRGEVRLATGKTVNLTDMIEETSSNVFHLKRPFTEDDGNRLLAETIKVMEAILPLHRQMLYEPISRTGQIEISTTPFYHPILPLIYDAHSGYQGEEKDLPKFSHPEDAQIQVAQAVQYYETWFGQTPYGMWPAEGAVSQEVIPLFRRTGIQWIASGDGVLNKSEPPGLSPYTPHRCRGPEDDEIAIFFRNTELSDYIGFKYQAYAGEEAADDLIRRILSHCPPQGQGDRLLTLILDGENAWEWYQQDMDGKKFLNAFYRKLAALYAARQVITVTPIEYLLGNPERGVLAHFTSSLPEIARLWPGSWIYADFSTWIGEKEENAAWTWLKKVRLDLANTAGDHQPLPLNPTSKQEWLELAWQEMWAAEGSDWFWWYGNDQNAPGGDRRFDYLFRTHLAQVYRYLQQAGYNIQTPEIPTLLLNPDKEGSQRDVVHQ